MSLTNNPAGLQCCYLAHCPGNSCCKSAKMHFVTARRGWCQCRVRHKWVLLYGNWRGSGSLQGYVYHQAVWQVPAVFQDSWGWQECKTGQGVDGWVDGWSLGEDRKGSRGCFPDPRPNMLIWGYTILRHHFAVEQPNNGMEAAGASLTLGRPLAVSLSMLDTVVAVLVQLHHSGSTGL